MYCSSKRSDAKKSHFDFTVHLPPLKPDTGGNSNWDGLSDDWINQYFDTETNQIAANKCTFGDAANKKPVDTNASKHVGILDVAAPNHIWTNKHLSDPKMGACFDFWKREPISNQDIVPSNQIWTNECRTDLKIWPPGQNWTEGYCKDFKWNAPDKMRTNWSNVPNSNSHGVLAASTVAVPTDGGIKYGAARFMESTFLAKRSIEKPELLSGAAASAVINSDPQGYVNINGNQETGNLKLFDNETKNVASRKVNDITYQRTHLPSLPFLDMKSQGTVEGTDNITSKKKLFCSFCFNNARCTFKKRGLILTSRHEGPWLTHKCKDSRGAVICPILAAHVCRYCGATGRNAHTEKYCYYIPNPYHAYIWD